MRFEGVKKCVCVRERARERATSGAWESVHGQYKVSHNVNVMYNTYLWRVRARRRGRGVGVAVQWESLFWKVTPNKAA